MRHTRNLSAYTRQQISNSLKRHHANKSEQAKKITRERQRASMKAYWSTVPSGEDINSPVQGCRTTNKVQPTKKI